MVVVCVLFMSRTCERKKWGKLLLVMLNELLFQICQICADGLKGMSVWSGNYSTYE